MLLNRNEIKRVCLTEIKNVWMDATNQFPKFLVDISMEVKTQNELYIKNISDQFNKLAKNFPYKSKKRKKWKQKMFGILEEVLHNETILGIHNIMSTERIEIFQNELIDFFIAARKFAPKLSLEGIGQAFRNYIVYIMIVEMNLIKPGFNKACFGYSMLYPFTDNYIDSNVFSKKEKIKYNEIIRKKIEGEKVDLHTLHQKKTCELLSMIESEYPRDKNSSIYMLLQIMLEAQEDSLRQQNRDCFLSYEERLNISICKGGISVLIDRFFVKKEIKKEDLKFYLEFGFFLQLIDDLQDIAEDSKLGHQTIFTIDLSSGNIEKITNKMFCFMHQIMNEYKTKNKAFMEFFLKSCFEFVCISIVTSKEFFSKEYLEKIEKYMPVVFEVIENIKRKKNGNKKKEMKINYLELLDEMLC